jgi:transcriptional regulator with XRE-family HTH domain
MQPSGHRIKYFRNKLGWTQSQLALRSGYSERLIRRAEAGEPLSEQTAVDLAAALSTEKRKVTVNDFSTDPLALAMTFVQSYDLYGRGLMPYCEHFLAEDFQFNCFGDASSPLTGCWHGKEGFQRWLDIFFGIFQRPVGFRLEPKYLGDGNSITARYLDMFTFQELVSPKIWVNLHFEFESGQLKILNDEYDTLVGQVFLEAVANRLGGAPPQP